MMQFELARDGAQIVSGVFFSSEVDELLAELPVLASAGNRTMLSHPVVAKVATDARIRGLVETDLGPSAQAVRAILFDKTADVNWSLAMHQDTKIAVREKVDIDGFTNWSTKDGVVHCQPPSNVLEQCVAIRIHLDDCPASRGALMVIPGTHRRGLCDGRADDPEPATLQCKKGDVILMKPLVLHGSRAATEPGHRRVLHIEYCSAKLPGPLDWAY